MPQTAAYIRARPTFGAGLAYRLRIIRVFARTEFKLKYAGSILGYFWSLAKPLIYFAVLWVVFGHIFRTGIPNFGLYLIVGVVLFTYLTDAVAAALPSIVVRGNVLRRISFPSIAIPLGSIASSTVTFLLNCLVVAVFVGIAGETPRLEWLLLLPLALEFVAFVVGIALILSSLFVRFRDVGQLWEVLSTVLLYSSAIMYPITILPRWAQSVVGFDPLVQVIQNARGVLLRGDPVAMSKIYTVHSSVYPILITITLLGLGVLLHRREAPRFPELA